MKKLLLAIALTLGIMLMIASGSAYAFSVNFDTYALNSWGRLYGDGWTDQDGNGFADPFGVPLAGLDPFNPGYSFDNPYSPAVNNTSQAFVPNVYGPVDGTEDTWGIVGVNRITDTSGNTIKKPPAGKEWAVFFWGGDDVMISNGAIPLLGTGIYTSGVTLELWETNALDGTTYSGTSVGLGTGGRSLPGDPTFFSTITDEVGGKRLLTLAGHPRFMDLNLSGAFEIAFDDTNGDGLPDIYDQVASAVGPPFIPPFTFATNNLFDVVGGLGDPWEALFDTNTIAVPNSLGGGLADFAFSGQFFDNRLFYGGPGNGFNLGDPDDMWTVYNQPSVQGNMIPEPTTMLLFGVGMLGLATLRRKRAA